MHPIGQSVGVRDESDDFRQSVQGRVGHGVEVFSLMRDSDLASEDYISRFFDTGAEHQRPVR